MRSVMIGGVAAACVLGLSACGDSDTKTEASAGERAKTAPGSIGAALDAPRPGLWRVTTVMEGAPGGVAIPTQEVCVTQAKLEPPVNPQQSGADCTTQAFVRQSDAMVGGAVCEMPGGMKTESSIRVTGDFNSRYVTEVRTKMSPAPTPAMAETTMTMTAERVGDC